MGMPSKDTVKLADSSGYVKAVSYTHLLQKDFFKHASGMVYRMILCLSPYIVCVDGKEVAPVQVNKAFLGFPLQKGAHEIQIEFHAPGKSLGAALSFVAFALLRCV